MRRHSPQRRVTLNLPSHRTHDGSICRKLASDQDLEIALTEYSLYRFNSASSGCALSMDDRGDVARTFEPAVSGGSSLARAPAGFDEVYRRYGGIVLHRCRSLLGNSDEALDATHDIFLRIIDRWEQFDPSRPLLPWLIQVTTNHCIDRIRARKETTSLEAISDRAVTQPELADRQLVRALLSRFDERTQKIVVHHYLDGFPQTAIAEMLGVSEKTVARKLQEFRSRADKWLARNGGAP
jgi:RNA polymerase sigma-70 factor, ECF subfamily